MAIDGVSPGSLAPTLPLAKPTLGQPQDSNSQFGDALRQLVGSVETSSNEANHAIGRMIDGTGDVHEAVIALQRADQMLQMTVQVRNKLVQAYQDVMRMPV